MYVKLFLKNLNPTLILTSYKHLYFWNNHNTKGARWYYCCIFNPPTIGLGDKTKKKKYVALCQLINLNPAWGENFLTVNVNLKCQDSICYYYLFFFTTTIFEDSLISEDAVLDL